LIAKDLYRRAAFLFDRINRILPKQGSGPAAT
jgi:hypothetical protein